MPQPTPKASFVDLQPDAEADALIDRALVSAAAGRMQEEMAGQLSAVPPPVRALVEALIGTIARLEAEVELLRQSSRHGARTRLERLAIDPLEDAAAFDRPTPPELPSHVELDADAEEFHGEGWHPVETRGEMRWRWSGRGEAASLLLPPLGGGLLRLRLWMLMPFGQPLSLDDTVLLADDVPVQLTPVFAKGAEGVVEGEVQLPEDGGFGPLTLVLYAPTFTAEQMGRDTRDRRTLGIGLRRIEVERVVAA